MTSFFARDGQVQRTRLPPLARSVVFPPLGLLAIVLTAASGRYGYHRDELYFRMLEPAWGYVDQPPLTPFLARVFSSVADEPWAMRVPATVATVLSAYVLVLITREMGGGRRAQALCAWGYSFASLPLIMGHALLTSTIDFPVWPAMLLFIIRGQLRRNPRWWLAAGLLAGLSLYNKLLIVVLVAALLAGVLAVGPRRILISPWVIAAVTLGGIVGFPNLLYQATHGWPQLEVGHALAAENAGEVRAIELPFLFLMLGPPLVPVWVAGIAGLLRRPDWHEARFIAVAFPALLLIVFAMGSQFYYPFGLLAVLYAIGCAVAEPWLARHSIRSVAAAAVALNATVSIVLGLPVIPLSQLGATPVPAINQIARDSVGWPHYVNQIVSVYATIPETERRRTVIVTSNYGEAGAVDRFGDSAGIGRVYSGFNALYSQAAPPADTTTVVFVGGQITRARALFRSCAIDAHLDNGLGVDNEEQGEPIAVCRGPIEGWGAMWPALRHVG